MAISEVVKTRAILMPFLPEDVFLRHAFLGGKHGVISGWYHLKEPTDPKEIIEILWDTFKLTPEQVLLQKCLKELFQYAVMCGDIVSTDLPMLTGGFMKGYALTDALWENPPVGQLILYQKPQKKPRRKEKTLI